MIILRRHRGYSPAPVLMLVLSGACAVLAVTCFASAVTSYGEITAVWEYVFPTFFMIAGALAVGFMGGFIALAVADFRAKEQGDGV